MVMNVEMMNVIYCESSVNKQNYSNATNSMIGRNCVKCGYGVNVVMIEWESVLKQ
jgi:hypothetical protein